MKRLIASCLLLSLLLCGCTGAAQLKPDLTTPTTGATEPTTEATQPTTEATEPTTEATEPTTEPTEPEPAYRHPLNGEPLDEPVLNRPYAVVFDNDCDQSVPHWGCGDVDILWEMPHEGGTTRMIGVLTDVSQTERFGPTRSVRPYLLSVARSFGAILVHAGGSPQGYDLLKSTKWDNLDGVQGPGAGSYYKRDKSRKVDSWHTMYITGENILKYTEKRGHENMLEEMADFGFRFDEDVMLSGADANSVEVRFKEGGKKSTFTYQEKTGDYTMKQLGMNYTDANTDQKVHFENILVLETKVKTIDNYGRLSQELEEKSGNGYFACNGRIIPIKWSRDNATDPFCFTDYDGNPITLSVGKTYIAVVYKGAPITVE
jgi:hypothetical protein